LLFKLLMPPGMNFRRIVEKMDLFSRPVYFHFASPSVYYNSTLEAVYLKIE